MQMASEAGDPASERGRTALAPGFSGIGWRLFQLLKIEDRLFGEILIHRAAPDIK
jgi:hypothetical protein